MTMDWRSNLRRTQSVKSIPSSSDKPTWTDVGLRDKTASVSQLVTRYQAALKVNKQIEATSGDHAAGKTKQAMNEMTPPSPRENAETRLESLIKRNKERDMSPTKTNLSRSKSEGSLRNSTGSIEAIKALFESKATAQYRVKRNVRAASASSAVTANMPEMNGEAEDVNWAKEEQKKPAENKVETDTKQDHMTQKVMNQTLMDKRKTIGGIDFEKTAASQAEEKRRSFADFKEKETLSISVKAISALYLSKVANQESLRQVYKPAQDQSRQSGKKGKLTKMAEDSQQRKDNLPQLPSERHQAGLKEVSGGHSQQSTPCQLSKERLYQQRQKCELRRLLKHTHPELKMLDDVVDEEFAEVLSSESVTAGETGYEGEVLSRCLIFENCGLSNNVPPYTPKIHMAKGAGERSDISKTSAVLETSGKEPHAEIVKEIIEDNKGVNLRLGLNRECEDEMMGIDVQATRRKFENQSRLDQKKCQRNVSMSREKTIVVKAQRNESEMSDKGNINKRSSTNLEEQSAVGQTIRHDFAVCKETPGSQKLFEEEPESYPVSEKLSDIKTSAALFKNNPFISANIEKEQSYGLRSRTSNEAGEDYLAANVKNRAHLFESMPFDKIRHQNKDEIEALVENIKETLNFLYRVKVIHSAGAIIEVNETMIAKKAKFMLSESGPEIKYDEVAEGGAQNFILQLLPRANLKPQITYLKEDSKEGMEATVVDVPFQQHHFNTNKESEFKTANVAQLVEDILNQDNSLRKGVIVQQGINNCADVIVYSLYKYLDEKDVKSYSPPQGVESGEVQPDDMSNRPETSQDQNCSLLIRPEIKGNVKLFKSCIEKGDLEYLKTLQAEPTLPEPETLQNQTVAGQDQEPNHEQKGDPTGEVATEWLPVDVKRLKNMFSGNKSQFKENCIQPAKVPHTVHKSQPSTEYDVQVKDNLRECESKAKALCNFKAASYIEAVDDSKIHRAELVDSVDKTYKISDFQTSVYDLQQTTMEVESFSHSLQENTLRQASSDKSIVSVSADNVKDSRTEEELPQENLNQNVESSIELKRNKLPSVLDTSLGQKSDWQCINTETRHEDSNFERVQTADTWSKENQESNELLQQQHIQTSTESAQSLDATPAQEEDEDVVLQGSVQAALKSLEKSNMNITKGDFKTAMIYRNFKKSRQEKTQNVDSISAQNPDTEESRQMTEPESNQGSVRKDVTSENMGAVSKKSKRQRGPKPALPPKPKHLMMKPGDKESSPHAQKAHLNIKDLNKTLINTVNTKETTQVPQPLPETSNESDHHQLLGEDMPTLKKTEAALESCQKDRNTTTGQQEINAAQGKDNVSETDESPVDFHTACQKFGGKKPTRKKTAPVKPKRVKIAHSSLHEDNNREGPVSNMDPKPEESVADPNTSGKTERSKNKNEKDLRQESKVEMREKKVRTETEDEQRQRLSVHMDEIVRGNTAAAREIFDNLRKREQLQSILNRVEEIEQETSEVDVKSLRKVFEDVPDWVVNSEKKKPKRNRGKNKEKSRQLPGDRTESKASMAHVYGDLERASEEIIHLKEQTLARLMDIEEAIKKALYSVSTLKSDSDIAGLSCLFKESLGAVQGLSSNGNINKISIGSNQIRPQETTQINTKDVQGAGTEQQPSPPSSPAFISIQSAARKIDKTGAAPAEALICPACQQSPKLGEIYRTTKTLTCNSPAQNRKSDSRKGRKKQSKSVPLNSSRELSVMDVQTDSQGKSITGTKTITENYERTDDLGNRFYSSKTSTVVDAQPETMATSQAAISPSTYQVTAPPGI